ncbi:type VI secretion system contractile sheath large subunit [Escherichia coli]|uniref:type VI secretion system contractile sheath large subunit n=1 Tax=Escherichia coli TaxID=562 RepID=UPI0027DF7DA6|nr:type VI secretion system contractile sheath large subunit [Escherichia coli]
MLMSVQKEKNVAESVVSETHAGDSVYASLFEKINLSPVSALSALDIWQDPQAMSEASADERLTAGMQVFMECLAKAGTQVEKLDKALIDHHIVELDYQISRQLDAVLHHPEFQKVESLWRGVKSLVDKTDFRRNVKIELLDLSKDDLRQDFEDAPEIIQSGLYLQTYVAEYDTPGGEPIAALVSAWEFDASAQDVALLKNISRVAASAHMPFIGSVGPAFFQKETMEEVAAIKDIGNHFERAEYIKWNAFRETDDARYIGLVMPRVLGRLPYGPDTPFADEVTLAWIAEKVNEEEVMYGDEAAIPAVVNGQTDDVLILESEAMEKGDTEGPEAALAWLQSRPGMDTPRHRWLIRLLMARVPQ